MILFQFWKIAFFLLICFTGCMRQSAVIKPVEPIRTLPQLNEYRQKGLVPKKIDRIYCSGGTLRLAVYLECADKVVAVDTHEHQEHGRSSKKAYLAAHPEFYDMPIGGEKRGKDNPETLLNLKILPQLIIKADDGGYDPVELTKRTGIPVLLIPLRSITADRKEFDSGLRLMGSALGKSERAEAVLEFFYREMTEIKLRIKNKKPPEDSKPLAYVGGVSYSGSHAFNSTEAGYPPFVIAEVNNPVKENDSIIGKRQIMISKEKIIEWNPDILFLDLATLYLGEASGLTELRTDPAYRSLKAVKENKVFTLLPNNFYFENHDAVLVNAWFVAKTMYPEQFTDIDPKKKADEIFTFLVGKPVFEQLNAELNNLALEQLLIPSIINTD
ncbi:MAG: ABC transporter substrate-binding protein [Planctomycetaceae bacterium]|jgi:iron complex transport system substrate-binding protein|nr:ABC transporter substrate-binding protein [Planctomycetaceae bacterium]